MLHPTPRTVATGLMDIETHSPMAGVAAPAASGTPEPLPHRALLRTALTDGAMGSQGGGSQSGGSGMGSARTPQAMDKAALAEQAVVAELQRNLDRLCEQNMLRLVEHSEHHRHQLYSFVNANVRAPRAAPCRLAPRI